MLSPGAAETCGASQQNWTADGRFGSFASDQRSHGLAGCPLHLQERPNIRTAAKRRLVPLPDVLPADVPALP